MGPKVRHLSVYSQSVYEHSMLNHFEQEFEKQEKIQKLKFAILCSSFVVLSILAVIVPLKVSSILKLLFL